MSHAITTVRAAPDQPVRLAESTNLQIMAWQACTEARKHRSINGGDSESPYGAFGCDKGADDGMQTTPWGHSNGDYTDVSQPGMTGTIASDARGGPRNEARVREGYRKQVQSAFRRSTESSAEGGLSQVVAYQSIFGGRQTRPERGPRVVWGFRRHFTL